MENNNTLDGMIAAEQAKLEKLEERQAEIGKKVRTCKANIEKYTLMKDSQKFNTLSNALDGKGISIEDILAAVSAGDLLTLQDKIEGAEIKQEEAPHEDTKSGE